MGARIKSMKLTEAEFTRQVIELAQHLGWRVAHFRPAQTSKGWRTAVSGDGAGFPDLVMVRDGRLIFAELKVGKNKLSPQQDEWLRELQGVLFRRVPSGNHAGGVNSVMAVEWRPDDWESIEYFLA